MARQRTLGDFIAEVIQKTGMKHGEIAAALNVHVVTVSQWKRNKQQPELPHLTGLLALLKPAVKLGDCLHLPGEIPVSNRTEIREFVRDVLRAEGVLPREEPRRGAG